MGTNGDLFAEHLRTAGQQTCNKCEHWTADNGGTCWLVGGHEFDQPGETPQMRALYPWQPEEQRKPCTCFRVKVKGDDAGRDCARAQRLGDPTLVADDCAAATRALQKSGTPPAR